MSRGDCEHLPSIEMEAFAEQVCANRRVPLFGSLCLTARCNLSCKHCYVHPYRDEEELATEEWRRILHEAAEMGCLSLLFTGGEPLTRHDFLDLYREARELGILATVFTNGTLVTRAIAEELAKRPPVVVEISLYGATEETCRRVTGKAGAFEGAVAGARYLLEAGLPVRLKTLLVAENVHELEAMESLAEELGVSFRFNGEVFGRLDGNPAPMAHALPPDECAAIEARDGLHLRVWRSMLEQKRPQRRSRILRCRGGMRNFHVGPYGDLNVCVLLPYPGWSLRAGSFREGWDTAMADYITTPASPNECDDCEWISLCFPCTARSHLAGRDPADVPREQCARARAIVRALESAPQEARS